MSLGNIEMSSLSEECCYNSLQTKETSEEEITSVNYCQCCTNISRLLFMFAWISYYILVIKILINTSYQQERRLCPFSDLWLYLLFSLIGNISLLTLNTRANHSNIYYLLQPNQGILVLKILFITWWTLELQFSWCLSDLKKTDLYTMSNIQYSIDILTVFVVSGASLNLVYQQDKKKKKEQKQAIREVSESFEDYADEEKELIS